MATPHTEKQQPPHGRERQRPDGAAAVLAVDDFCQRKGAIKALQRYRQRQERKRLHTAAALRSYKKAMKKEGYEPGTGASRKRNIETDGGEESSKSCRKTLDRGYSSGDVRELAASAGSSKVCSGEHPIQDGDPYLSRHSQPYPNGDTYGRGTKRQKTNPFQKSLQRAERLKAAQLQREQDRAGREQERLAKLQQRRKRTKRLRQRTRKGQPVMKNIVEDILEKLQNEQQQQHCISDNK